MHIRNLLKLSLMISGIWLLLFSLGTFSTFFYALQVDGMEAFVRSEFIVLIYYLLVTYALLFRADLILRLVQASPEFMDSDVSFQAADLKAITKGILITAALWLIIFNIAPVLVQGFTMIREANALQAEYENSRQLNWLITDIVSIFLGVSIILNYDRLGNWIVGRGLAQNH